MSGGNATAIVERTARRSAELYAAHCDGIHQRTDRLFAWLSLAQWVGGIACALWISPRTWAGTTSSAHPHLFGAVVLGGTITACPVLLAWLRPGRVFTRHIIAASQMLWSALLIDLTGGRIETHFHVFGSLAFLAFYRDWRVFVTATIVVAADHFLRGTWAPQSVFGITSASRWRWLEHAGWVIFEDAFLISSCRRGLEEMHEIAQRQARLEESKSVIEEEVRERTKELRSANESLAANQVALGTANEELRKAAAEREALHTQLMETSRQAGMAEVATGVLHNVGNVLNSVNVAASVVAQKLRDSEVTSLGRAADLIGEHRSDLARFLQSDERGRHLPEFLVELARCLNAERELLLNELKAVTQGIDHVKHVVSMQQTYAKRASLIELVTPAELAEAALTMQLDALSRHKVTVDRQFEPLAAIRIDKHRVLQILVNLISNAKEAMSGVADRRLTIAVRGRGDGGGRQVTFEVTDNGVGIAQENLAKIFAHGFTTRKDGHGFGLHSAANGAREMGGSLAVSSAGLGKGATFLLVLPVVETAGEAAGGPAHKAAA